MGRKVQGAALRAKKRAKEASQELTESTAQDVETAHVVKKTDEQLFVLDTTAAVVPGGVQKESSKKRKKGLSGVDKKKVDDLLQKHDAKELTKMVKENKARVEQNKKQKRTATVPKHDLWDVEEQKATPVSTPTPGIGNSLAGTAPGHMTTKTRAAGKMKKKTLALQVAHGGQSYHPDAGQHQDVIGEALALELRRKEISIYNAAPLSAGMSELTKSLLVDSDKEDSEDEEEDDNDDDVVITKRKEKLTRADKNRKKRHRALEKELDERKRAKKLGNSVYEAKGLKKAMTKKQRDDQERKEILKKLKEDSVRTLGTKVYQNLSQRDPIGVPTMPVALSKELQSSLRSIKPKGSLLEDRLESFRDRKMATPKHVGDRKRIVAGKKRRVKVKGRIEHKVKMADGGDCVMMG